MATPPPREWRRSLRNREYVGIDNSELEISGVSQVSQMQIKSGLWRETNKRSSSNLEKRLRALKEKIVRSLVLDFGGEWREQEIEEGETGGELDLCDGGEFGRIQGGWGRAVDGVDRVGMALIEGGIVGSGEETVLGRDDLEGIGEGTGGEMGSWAWQRGGTGAWGVGRVWQEDEVESEVL